MSRSFFPSAVVCLALALLASAALAGCYRDLDLAICRKNPSDPVCFADASGADAANETSAADGSVGPGGDAAADGRDTSAATDAIDARVAEADAATDVGNETFGLDVAEASTEAGGEADVSDTSPDCADAGPATQSCGKCGTQTRTCVAPGVWSAWSACSSEGVCVPGENTEVSGSCPGVLEKRFKTCETACSWGPEACRLPKGWTPIAPSTIASRLWSTAVWTGSELLVFGGATADGARLGDGGAFALATNTWSTIPADTARSDHSAVWDGTRMLIWGGSTSSGVASDGARYDPASRTWTLLSAAPIAGRSHHHAVWSTTSKEMIVWGGINGMLLADGAAYDPVNDQWTQLPAAPLAGRTGQVMVWTGTEVLIWGGRSETADLADGALYNPVTKTWRALPSSPLAARIKTAAAPSAAGAVLFGGMSEAGIWPTLRIDGADVSTGATPTWTVLPLVPGSYVPRADPAFWRTETGFIVFSGRRMSEADESFVADGWQFDHTTQKWSALPTTNSPTPRVLASAVWTGSSAVVWGGIGPIATDAGSSEGRLSTGAVYVP